MVDNDKIRTADLASTFSLVVQLRTQKSDLVTPVNLISNRFWLG
jgi:hypothetical protein